MSPHIGIITATNSMERIAEIDKDMRRLCEVTYLPYTTLAHLTTLYKENVYRFDGLIFSGRFNYLYVLNHIGAISKPHTVFELTDRDYYKTFTKLYFQNPGLDIRRVLMEAPTTNIDFSDVFENASPQYFNIAIDASLMNTYESVRTQALELWRAGKIDHVVSRFTNLEQDFLSEEIPFDIMFPSRLSMLESFTGLFSKLQSQALEDSLAAFGLVRCLGEVDETLLSQVNDTLESFNTMNGTTLVLRKNDNAFEISTSNETLLDITQGYTNCLLSMYLREQLQTNQVIVGWGVGHDVVDAYKHAELAIRSAANSSEHHTFLINHDEERIGPLVSGRSVILQTMPTAGLVRLSQQMGISQLNLQRLLSLQHKRKTALFRSADLAYHMHITHRSANRILAKLVRFGCANVAHSSQPVSRGRPGYVYEVDFEKLAQLTEA